MKKLHTSKTRKFFLIFLCVALSFISVHAQTTYTVSNTNDTGTGSLRQAIEDANANSGADFIDMTGISGTILLDSGLPKITESLTINGPGEENLSISGQNMHRPFFINSGTVTLESFSIVDGYAKGGDGGSVTLGASGGGGGGMGGGLITNTNVDLTLENITFDGNQAIGGNGGPASYSNNAGPAAAGGVGPFFGSPSTPSGNGGFGSGGSSGEYILVPSVGGSTHGGNGGYGAGGGGSGSAAYRDNSGDPIPLYPPGVGGKHGGDGGVNCTTLQSQAGNCDQTMVGELEGGGGAGLGGAVFSRATNTIIRNVTFINNTATGGTTFSTDVGDGKHSSDGQGKGGAILIYSEAGNVPTYSLEGIIYAGNNAGHAGSIDTDNHNIYLETGLTFVDNTVLGIKRSIPENASTAYADGTDIEVWFNVIPYADAIQTTLDNTNIESKIFFREKVLLTAVTFTATIVDNKVTITPTQALDPGKEYRIDFQSVYDENGNNPTIPELVFSRDISLPTFNTAPSNGQLLEGRVFTLNANEPVLKTDGSPIINGDLASLLSINENNGAGAAVPHTATILGEVITITIDQPVADQVYHIAINNVEDQAGNELTVEETFTLTSPSGISLMTAPGDGGTIGKRLYEIHADQPLFNADNTPLTDGDLTAKLMLKENDMNGADVAFDAFLEGNSIYIATNALTNSSTYWVSLDDIEDVTGIELAQQTFTFATSNLFNPVSGAGFAVDFMGGQIDTDDISLAGDFTIEAWVKTTDSDGLLVGNELAGGLIEFGLVGDKLFIGDGTTSVSSTTSINDDIFHHVAVSLSGTTAQLYIDGVADGSGTIASASRTINRVGNGQLNSAIQDFTGSLDEIRIWNTAVSGTDIANNRLAALDGSHPDIANLAALFSLDESKGIYAHDYNGNLTQGSLSGNYNWEVSTVTFPAADFELRVDGQVVAFEGTYDFGSLGLNSSSSIKTVQIENTGTVDLLLRGNPFTSLSGTGTGQFTIDETGMASVLAPAATTTFTMTYTPTIAGFTEVELSVENGSINDPYRIKIRGTGLDITTSGNWDFVGGSPGVLSLMRSSAAHNGEFYAVYTKPGVGTQLAKLVGNEFQDIGAFSSNDANMEISPGGRIFTFSTNDVNTASSVSETNTAAGGITTFSNSNNFSINNLSAISDRTRFVIAFDATKAYAAYSYADDGNVSSMQGIKIDELVSDGSTSNLATLTLADLGTGASSNIFAYDIAFDANDNLWVVARTHVDRLFLAKYDGSWTVYDLSATPGLQNTGYVSIEFDSNDDMHISNMGGLNTIHYIKASTAGTVLTSDVLNTFTTYSSSIKETAGGGFNAIPFARFALGTDEKPIFVYVDSNTSRPKAFKYDNGMFNEFSEEFMVADQVSTAASEPFNFSIDPVSGRAFLAYTTTTASNLNGALQSVVSTNPIVPEIAVFIDDTEVISGAEFLLQAGVGFEKSITLKIENTGVTGIQLTGNPIIDFTGTNTGALSYDLEGLTTTLAPDAFIEIPISFSPQAPFDEVISVSITDNTPSGETTFSLQLSGLDNSNTNTWEEYSNVNSAILNSVDMTIKNGRPLWAHNKWVLLNAVNNPNTGMLENFEYAELHLHDIYVAGNITPISTIAAYNNDPTIAGNWALQAEQLDYFQKIRFVQNENDESTILLNARPYTADPMGTPYEDFAGNPVIQSGDGFNFYKASTSLGYHDMIVDEAGDIFSANVDFDPSDSFYDLVVIKGTQAINTNVAQITNTIANGDNDIDMEADGSDLYIAYADGTTLNVINFLKTDVVNTSPTNILTQTDARTLGSSDSRTKDLEFSESGQLYLAYIENSTNQVRVKSYDGTGSNWTDLPVINFGSIVGTPDPIDLQLQIHPDGIPFVSTVLDLGNGQQGFVAVHRYINGAWELVGNTVIFGYPGFNFDGSFFSVDYSVQKAILQITDDGKPYLLAGNKVYTINLAPDDFDQVPEFTSMSPVASVDEEVSYTYNIVTDDADAGDVLTITASDVPSWLTFTDNGDRTATLTGTPADADVANYVITLTVSDGIIDVDQVVNLEVTNVNDDPDFFIEDITYEMDENDLDRTIDITGITDGDDQVDQILTFSVTSDNTALVNDQAVDFTQGNETATLIFSHTPDMFGEVNLTVRLEDDGTLFKEQVVSVSVVEGVISLINISSGTLALDENSAIGTEAGLAFVTDVDFDETYTFSLVSGAGDTDNDLFNFVGNSLQTTAALDFETLASASVRIEADNGIETTYEETFTIAINNLNEAATDFTLSSTDIDEGVPVGTVVGTFSATDPDATNTHTYSLVNGFGDNASFQINGSNLEVAEIFDFDDKASYSIQIVLDDSGLMLTQDFTITVNDINVAPMAITLSNASIPENSFGDFTIGTLDGVDSDDTDTHIFQFVSTNSFETPDFKIVGDELKTNRNFDFETEPTIDVEIRAFDNDNASVDQTLTISFIDANDVPTGITISSSEVEEAQPAGTEIGILSAMDQDAGDTHTFTLVSGFGENYAVNIVGNSLQTVFELNFDFLPTLNLKVNVNDGNGGINEFELTITITNANQAPTAISLSTNSIDENTALGTTIGALTTTDSDVGDAHTYSLVTGFGDNDHFAISGSDLTNTSVFNFEVKSSYSIKVKTDDNKGGTFEQEFSISVNDVNEAPTTLTLSANGIDENTAFGTNIGSLSTTDEDTNDSHTFSLISGFGDNADFSISGAELSNASVFHFETKSSYSIKVSVDDSNGGVFEQEFTITVNDVNLAPTDIILSNTSVDENSQYGEIIGTLSSIDPDTDNTHTYKVNTSTIVDGVEIFDFFVDEDLLKVSRNFDFESEQVIMVDIQVFDQNGLSFDKTFDITINDVNERPTEPQISNLIIDENVAIGTVVGIVSADDPDAGDILSYSLNPDYVNGNMFELIGNELKTAVSMDFELQNNPIIELTATDQGGLEHIQVYTIMVNDLNEAPTSLVLSNDNIDEDAVVGSVIGTLSTEDQDAGDTHTYEVLTSFTFEGITGFPILANGSDLFTTIPMNFEIFSSFTIDVKTTDTNGLDFIETFTILINDVNESPSSIGLSANDINENTISGTTIGSFSTTDEDTNDSHIYSLISGFGDNSDFAISGTDLTNVRTFDFETKASYSIKIETDDRKGGTFEQEFIISINDVNEAPTSITLSSNTIEENVAVGTLVGTLSSSDPDANSAISYALVSGFGDNSDFSVSGNNLSTATVFDFETKASYAIKVKADDGLGGVFEREFTIAVLNVTEGETQTITFDTLPSKTFGDASFDLTATASSGLDINFTSSDESIVSINGNTATILEAGEVTITATQPGVEGSFEPADPVSQVLTVNKATQTITFDEIEDQVTGANPITLNATASSSLAITYSVSGPASLQSNVLTFTGIGEVYVTASQGGNENYLSASVTRAFVVTDPAKTDQIITFNAPTSVYINETPVILEASSDSGLDIEFEIISGNDLANLSGDNMHLTGLGTVEVVARQVGNDNFNPAVVTATIEVKPVFTLSGVVVDENDVAFSTGTLLAYRVEDQTIYFASLTESGYIENFKDGTYYLAVEPTDPSSYYTTLYGDVIFWESATSVTVNSNMTNLDIKMVVKSSDDLLTGNGTLIGRILDGGNNGGRIERGRILNGDPIEGVSVFLIRISDDQIMTEVISDANGDFEINGIPEGEYRLQVEVTGVTMDLGNATISVDAEGTPIELTALVGEDGIVLEEVITSLDELFTNSVTIYPNPFDNHLNFKMENELLGQITLQLFTIDGRELYSSTYEKNSLEYNFQLDDLSIPSGIVLLRLVHKDAVAIFKLLKN